MKILHLKNFQRGQSLIEILFAITIFTIGVVTVGYLIIEAKTSIRYATDLTQARLLAAEGIEAVSSIRAGGFDLVPAGTYGLTLENGLWELAPSPDEKGKFTRTITVVDTDEDNKVVTSLVTWNRLRGNEKEILYTTHFSNWMQNNGEAGDLKVSIDDVAISASSTALTGLNMKNTGDSEIALTKMVVAWDTPVLLDGITIAGIEVFAASTSQPIASGEEIDITDYKISASPTIHWIDAISFAGEVTGTNFIVRFIFADGSIRSVYVTPE